MDQSNKIVPELNTSLVHPTTSGKKTTKRSSKSVRIRKRMARRIVLNKSCAERIQKSFHINTIVVDGVECDFADAFAFMDWYQDNLARLEHVPEQLVLKFREQYIALNPSQDEDEFLRDIIRHKFLFDDCTNEKNPDSDFDESVSCEVYKSETDVCSDETLNTEPRTVSPEYRSYSPESFETTSHSGFSDNQDDNGYDVGDAEEHRYVNLVKEKDVQVCSSRVLESFDQVGVSSTPKPSNPDAVTRDVKIHQNRTLLYQDLGGQHLCAQMTESDYKEIDRRKRKLLNKRMDSNVKIRYGEVTLYLTVRKIVCYHRDKDIPLISVDPRDWDACDVFYPVTPQIVVRSTNKHSVASVVVMG